MVTFHPGKGARKATSESSETRGGVAGLTLASPPQLPGCNSSKYLNCGNTRTFPIRIPRRQNELVCTADAKELKTNSFLILGHFSLNPGTMDTGSRP